MDNLIKAIASNDIVKFKRCFNEAMASVVSAKLTEERLAIAGSILVAGEIVEAEDEVEIEDDESEDDEDGSEDDEEDKKVKVKTKEKEED